MSGHELVKVTTTDVATMMKLQPYRTVRLGSVSIRELRRCAVCGHQTTGAHGPVNCSGPYLPVALASEVAYSVRAAVSSAPRAGGGYSTSGGRETRIYGTQAEVAEVVNRQAHGQQAVTQHAPRHLSNRAPRAIGYGHKH